MSKTHRREQPYKEVTFNGPSPGTARFPTPTDRKEAKATGRDDTAFHFDAGKPRVDVLPPEALEQIGLVFGYGAAKYGEWNWAEHASEWDWNQLYASCVRHLLAWQRREDLDSESKLPHLAHAACNIMMLMQLIMAGLGNDDRNPIYKDPSPLMKAMDDALVSEGTHLPGCRCVVCATERRHQQADRILAEIDAREQQQREYDEYLKAAQGLVEERFS